MSTLATHTTVQIQTTQAAICRLLECTAEQYAQLQYKNGCSYLQHLLPNNEHSRHRLEASKLFWSWFKMLCHVHDQAYISSPGIEKISLQNRRRIYKALHCSSTLALEIKPNSIVLADINKKHTHEHSINY